MFIIKKKDEMNRYSPRFHIQSRHAEDDSSSALGLPSGTSIDKARNCPALLSPSSFEQTAINATRAVDYINVTDRITSESASDEETPTPYGNAEVPADLSMELDGDN